MEPVIATIGATIQLGKIEYTKGPGSPTYKLEAITPATHKAVTVKKENLAKHTSVNLAKGLAANVRDALLRNGFEPMNIGNAMLMLDMESGGFSNGAARNDNNPGNIMWNTNVGKMGFQKGTWIPGNQTYAVHFNNLDEFAKFFYKLLSAGGDNAPIYATTLKEFAHRLKLRNYYGDESEESYFKKLNHNSNLISDFYIKSKQTSTNAEGERDTTVEPAYTGDKNVVENWWKKQAWYVKGGIIVGGFLLILTAIKK